MRKLDHTCRHRPSFRIKSVMWASQTIGSVVVVVGWLVGGGSDGPARVAKQRQEEGVFRGIVVAMASVVWVLYV